MSATTVRLSAELKESLEAAASKLHRSQIWLINPSLKEFVDRQELEQARWQDTLAAMESAAQGKVLAAEEFHGWLHS